MKILIDNGHGDNTAGKRSPDGRHREYAWTRDIARRLVTKLKMEGYDAELLVPETKDISLKERCRRVNAICAKQGSARKVLLISIHNNAAGNGKQWMTARGWSVHVGLNASTRSMVLAEIAYETAARTGVKVRRPSRTQNFWQQNLYILQKSNCPAILTENFFQDNRDDVTYLQTEEGKATVVLIHYDTIKEYIKRQQA